MGFGIRKVTEENQQQIMKMHVKNTQTSYVETVEESLADAREHSEYLPVGLYQDDTLIGFAMYGFFANEDEFGVEEGASTPPPSGNPPPTQRLEVGGLPSAHADKTGRVWLDRYFIDERFQGQGLGGTMLEVLLNHLKSEYQCSEIYLSLYEDNQHALHLYKKFGFSFTGELDINGEKVMVKKYDLSS